MTTDVEASERRKRGSIRRIGACLQVRVSAGEDPSTGDRIVLVESVQIEKPGNERSERVAMNAAEKIRTRLLAEADSLKVARTKSTLGALLDRWLPQHEIDPTTRMNYESQIRNYIRPNLGDVPLLLLVRDASERLETYPEQMARIVEAAWKASNEWGLYVWLSAVTGARRGEVIALQWDDIDLAGGILRLDENYVRTADGMILKDTKTHQMRRVSVDDPTVELLRKHKEDCTQRMFLLGLPLRDDAWLFSAQPDLSKPRDPSSVTRRYSRLTSKLGVDIQLKQLRHYSATELLTAGVDSRTVAGRLGHGDGTTTLRHYAAWVGSADQAAAKAIGSRMPSLIARDG